MNNEYLLRAKEVIPDAKTLIVLAAKRAKALAYGARRMVNCKDDNHLDIALLEIAEGKLTATAEKVKHTSALYIKLYCGKHSLLNTLCRRSGIIPRKRCKPCAPCFTCNYSHNTLQSTIF